jgi:hypothetical protein
MPFRRCARTKPADISPVCEWGFHAHSRAHRCGGGGGGGGSRWDWDAQPWLGGGGTRRLVVLKGFVRRGKPEGGVRGLVSANFALSVLVSGRCISPSLQSLLVCTLFMLVCALFMLVCTLFELVCTLFELVCTLFEPVCTLFMLVPCGTKPDKPARLCG